MFVEGAPAGHWSDRMLPVTHVEEGAANLLESTSERWHDTD